MAASGSQIKRRRERDPEKYGVNDVNYSAVSQIEQETFSFLWEIKSYSQIRELECLKSPVFFGGKARHAWQLKITPKKMAREREVEFFGAHLVLVNFGDENETDTPNRKVKANFQITILREDGTPGKQVGGIDGQFRDFEKLTIWGYGKFLSTSTLESAEARLLVNNMLKIHCQIWLEGEVKSDVFLGGNPIPSKAARIQRGLDLLAKDFGGLLTSGVCSDVKIKAGNREFSLHKAVLSARSEVFAAMFRYRTPGRDGDYVEISDDDENSVQGMMEYIYTGETEKLSENAPELLPLAVKYGIPGLKEDCETVISERISVLNAADVLVISKMYDCNVLKAQAMEFIRRNKETLIKTASFQRIAAAYPETFVELYLAE